MNHSYHRTATPHDGADERAAAGAVTITRRQRQVMLRIRDEGLLLLAESNGECWLFGRDERGMVGEPVERISDVLAERLVLRGLVRGSGTLTDAGRAALAPPRLRPVRLRSGRQAGPDGGADR